MSIELQKIEKQALKPSLWNGGSTFEYVIYPKSANYGEHNFLFRISSATIETVPSVFTRFENYHRYLVMLDYQLMINHNGIDRSFLPHEIFAFNSMDEVHSMSTGNDFNWMISSSISDHTLRICQHKIVSDYQFMVLFFLVNTEVVINENTYACTKYTCYLIENPNHENVHIFSSKAVIFGELNLE